MAEEEWRSTALAGLGGREEGLVIYREEKTRATGQVTIRGTISGRERARKQFDALVRVALLFGRMRVADGDHRSCVRGTKGDCGPLVEMEPELRRGGGKSKVEFAMFVWLRCMYLSIWTTRSGRVWRETSGRPTRDGFHLFPSGLVRTVQRMPEWKPRGVWAVDRG